MSTQRFIPEFKEEAVKQVTERDYSDAEVSARHVRRVRRHRSFLQPYLPLQPPRRLQPRRLLNRQRRKAGVCLPNLGNPQQVLLGDSV